MNIPSREDWGNYKSDLDVKYAYKLYGGLSIEDSQQYFIDAPIQRASELRYAPFAVFKYYVFCFTKYLCSQAAKEEADMASVFLGLVYEMSEKYPNEFAEFYPNIELAIKSVSENQKFYDADIDIYGSFIKIRSDIIKTVKKVIESHA